MRVTQNYQTIQMLRFVAASAVALTHVTFYIQTRVNPSIEIWKAGAQGVQLFFVISGFVMALSSGAISGKLVDWSDFILRRLVRIVPLYWVMNFVKLAILFLIPSALFAKPDWFNIFLSLFFIPSKNENGIIETFYGVGWTLNFEIFFYLIIAFFLFFRVGVVLFSTLTLGFLLALSSLRQDDWPSVTYLLHPYLANFIWGLLIAKLVSMKNMDKPLFGSVLVILSSYFIFIDQIFPTMSFLGVQYAALVMGLVMIESTANGKIPRLILFGGDVSYSLYLTHAMVGPIVVVAVNKLGMNSKFGLLSISYLMILVTAIVCHIYVERRLGKLISDQLRLRKKLNNPSINS